MDEITDLRIEYGDAVADIHLSWRAPIRKNVVTAYGEKGVILFDDDRVLVSFGDGELKQYIFDDKLSASSAHPLWTKKTYIDFYESCYDRKKFEENFNQAKECITIIEKAYENYRFVKNIKTTR